MPKRARHHQPRIRADYLGRCFRAEDFRLVVREVIERLRPLAHTFDTIAFRGVSGALVAPTVACRLRKHLLVVRKLTTKSHSCYGVEGNINTERYCIIDDFIASGDTIRQIVQDIREEQERERIRLILPDSDRGKVREEARPPVGQCVLLCLYRERVEQDVLWTLDDEKENNMLQNIRRVGTNITL